MAVDDTGDLALGRLVDQARAAYPELAEHLDDLAARLAQVDELDEIHSADLLLACAAARGATRAIAEIDRQIEELRPALRRVGVAEHAIGDVLQELRQWLFVGDGRGPRVLAFGGRGTLAAWLRVVAIRRAHRARDAARRDRAAAAAEPSPQRAGVDPELDYLKAAYRVQFAEALSDAIAGLPRRERNLLRLHIGDGLTIDQLAAIYHIHRATVARQLNAARAAVVDRIRGRLSERLELGADELDSILRLIASRVDVSIRSLLRRPG